MEHTSAPNRHKSKLLHAVFALQISWQAINDLVIKPCLETSLEEEMGRLFSLDSDDEAPQVPESPDRPDTPMRVRPNGGMVGVPRRSTIKTCHVNPALQVIFNVKPLAEALVE